MRRIVLGILLCTLTFAMFGCSCGKEEEKIEYGEKEAVAEGTVNLSGKEPKISISNIKAKVGSQIDYLSNVIVENEEDYEDLEVWVNESAVDIYEPGDYIAIYTFKYDGKSIEHKITVTIWADESEESASDTEESATDNSSEQATTSSTGSVTQNTTSSTENNEVVQNTSKNETTTKPTSNTTTTSKNTSTSTTTKNNTTTTTTKNSTTTSTTKNNTTTSTSKSNTTTTTTKKPTSNTTTATTKRQMITTSGLTTEAQNIGYSYIELLSGSVVSIKTTTAKYIVSTRTDVSYTTKNNVKYKVSKLIITYNTGDERTLETVEEKCN